MPTVLTRGAGSARGFGLFESGITTRKETFTSNGSWTCPVGVTSLIYLRGKGQNGVSDYASTFLGNYGSLPDSGPFANAPYADWGDIYAENQGDYNSIPSSGFAGSAQLRVIYWQVASNDTWEAVVSATKDLSGYYITSKNNPSFGSPPTSGNVLYSQGLRYWYPRANFTEYGNVGANTTAFGYTFTGGSLSGTYPNQTGNTAATTTYTSVSVTPGTTYNFVVPSGGSVEFAYYT